MADLISLVGSAATGGVFGLLGTVFGRVAGFFERGQTFKQDQARWGHEYKLHELNQAARLQESEIELNITDSQGSWEGMKVSHNAAAAIGKGSQWVINTMHMVRPTLTILLWLIAAGIAVVTKDKSIGEAVMFAATAATLWWFGDRAPKYKSKSNERV